MKKLLVVFVSLVFFSSAEAMDFDVLDTHLRLGTLTLDLIPSPADLKEGNDKQQLKELVLLYRSFIDSYISSTLVRGADAKQGKLENALVAAALASLAGLDVIEGSSTYDEAQNKLSSTLYNVELPDDSTYGDTSANISNVSVSDVEFLPDDSTVNRSTNDVNKYSPKKEDTLSHGSSKSFLDKIEGGNTYDEAQKKLSSTLYNVELPGDSTNGDTSCNNISKESVTDAECISDDSMTGSVDYVSSIKEERFSYDTKSSLSVRSLSITSLVAIAVTYAFYVKYRREEYALPVC